MTEIIYLCRDPIFILASGKQERWKSDLPKQLVKIGDEILIQRIQRQAGTCTVVTHDNQIKSASSCWISPGQVEPITATVLSTIHHWNGRVTILLGDVIYSDEVMQRILSCTIPFAVFGQRWEIFALSFDTEILRRSVRHGIQWACNVAIDYYTHRLEHIDEPGWEMLGRGKLWEMYRIYCGLPITSLVLEHAVFQFVNDYTDDIDTIEEYHQFMDKNQWADISRSV